MAEYTKATRKGIDLKEANAGVFYRAFRSMDAESRHRLALQILKDEDLLEDLYEIRREKHIKQRDKLIRLLSSEGWTQSRIANEVGMIKLQSPELFIINRLL